MSGIGTAIGVFGVATSGAAVMAAIDPSIEKITTAVVGAGVTITLSVIAYKTLAMNKKLDNQDVKIDETLKKTVVIEGHVNSERTRLAGEISSLQQEVRILREVAADKKETAALLAQAAVAPPKVE